MWMWRSSSWQPHSHTSIIKLFPHNQAKKKFKTARLNQSTGLGWGGWTSRKLNPFPFMPCLTEPMGWEVWVVMPDCDWKCYSATEGLLLEAQGILWNVSSVVRFFPLLLLFQILCRRPPSPHCIEGFFSSKEKYNAFLNPSPDLPEFLLLVSIGKTELDRPVTCRQLNCSLELI